MLPTLAICSVVRDEGLYIAEWLAFHLLQGASKILVYDDRSTDRTRDIVKRASAAAPIELIEWGNDQAAIFDGVQRAAFKDAVFSRALKNVDFTAFIDADEFLFSNAGSLPEALAEFPSDVSVIAINQRVFGSSGHTSYSPELVTSRFTKSTAADHAENEWFKSIVRPSRVYGFSSVHTALTSWGRQVLNDQQVAIQNGEHPGRATQIGDGSIRLNHYMLKSLEEFRQKQARGRLRAMDRYGDAYFFGRDTSGWANAAENGHLATVAAAVRYKMAELGLEA